MKVVQNIHVEAVKRSMTRRVVAISGMPGSGKSIVSSVAREMGYHVYSMGDVVRNEAQRLGVAPTPVNLGRITLELRKEKGSAIVARMLVDRLMKDSDETVVVEGVRSMDEVYEFRKHFKVIVLAVVSSPQTRYSRLKSRSRSDDPRDFADFEERDKRELGLGISKVVDSGDGRILNESDEGTFRHQVRDMLVEMLGVG